MGFFYTHPGSDALLLAKFVGGHGLRHYSPPSMTAAVAELAGLHLPVVRCSFELGEENLILNVRYAV